ncbi:MAG: hypothetical protein AAFW75_24545, partial [Cyanobacteria bacterium J06636_16]
MLMIKIFLATFNLEKNEGEIEKIIENFSMLLIPLTLVACIEAASRPKVVSVVVGIEDVSTEAESISNASFEDRSDSHILPAISSNHEHIEGFCDQDKCNVMTADGVYNYYIIADYRYIIGCYQDTPKKSFHRARGERQTRKP